uniref:Uncharacterized protein n=1 Tax=Arundo donax TaxID=35708 RepID=A0A0A9EVF6_ARUDO
MFIILSLHIAKKRHIHCWFIADGSEISVSIIC